MTELEKAYLAGIIDGEGTITLTPDGEFRYPSLSFCNNDKAIIDYVNQFCKGVVTTKHSSAVNEKWSDNYVWHVCGRNAINTIAEILPYMHEQKKIRRGRSILDNYIRLTPRNGKYSVELKNEKLHWQEQFFKL